MRTVKEVSKLTGVSVRALHHYDAIGLLKPTEVTEAGYRLYDDAALARLQNILLFRELQFPLKEIKAILDSPSFDLPETVARQIKLLELQYQRLGKLISFACEIQRKGANIMKFDVFDQSEMERYQKEAKEKWGTSVAYREYEEKSAARDKNAEEQLAKGMMALLSEIGALKQKDPADETVQEKISALQRFITENYYNCTDEILKGLGEMYASDERFRKNIDQAGGDGTAEFASRAIAAYCDRRKSH